MTEKLDTISAQEIYDTVARHLFSQGRKAAVRIGGVYSCVYRGPRGLKCAVGCLIRDDEYDRVMENHGVTDLCGRNRLPQRLIPHAALLLDLQDVHDEPPKLRAATLRQDFQLIADGHGLSPDVLAGLKFRQVYQP